MSLTFFLVTVRARHTYSDFNENAHPRVLLILLFPLVPFKCTILSWFVLSQRSAFLEQLISELYIPSTTVSDGSSSIKHRFSLRSM